MRDIHYGSKYNSKLTRTEIAAKFRADVKVAVKAGELPKGLKLSVRRSGNSINVVVKACPGVNVMNPAVVLAKPDFSYPARERYTAEALSLREKLDGMLDAYNFNGSQIEVDYFHVNFYGNVEFDYAIEKSDRVRILMLSDKGAEMEMIFDVLVRGLTTIASWA